MNIKSRSIDKTEFMQVLSFLSRRKKENLEQSLDEVTSILDSSQDAYDFLKKADAIEDEDIQNLCRRAVFAQMYDARASYEHSSSSCNYIDFCRNQIAVLEVAQYFYIDSDSEIQRRPGSSVIISKYGDILVDEGILWLNSNAFYGHYVVTHKIIDDNIEGIYSDEGEMVIPFGLLDNIHLSYSWPTAEYKGLKFAVRIYGKIKDVDTNTLERMDDDRIFLFISPCDVILSLSIDVESIDIDHDSVLIKKALSQKPVGAEFMEKIAPYRITREVIQQELARRERQNNVHRGVAENPIKE